MQNAKKTLRDVNVEGKRVLVRVDFNVPLDINTGAISDDSRIRASLPTIKYLIEHKARVILCTHLGRPQGQVVENLRVTQVAKCLSHFIGLPVNISLDCVGPGVENEVKTLKEGNILFLENLRFHSEEEANDLHFAQKLARLADVYVNDAFGTAHRTHASTVNITKYLPAVAGFLMEKELDTMNKLLTSPAHPFACLIGGAKVSDKMGLIQNMLKRIDVLLVGGGMAATFLRAQGYETGRSLVEKDKLSLARELLEESKEWNIPLLLPTDIVVANEIKATASTKIASSTNMAASDYLVDIGPETIELFSRELRKCHTIMWNGPMGVYEIPQFAQGTRSLVKILSTSNAVTVIGGGSSAEIVHEMRLTDKMTHVSTGGGASLRCLEGLPLPGVEALLNKI
ncbi:MAG: phosphoglycerate kinase [Dehalococcoidia bacterium]|nr:phosphoglycerate kinase [Dehalococcoidia bacterium]